MHLDGVHDIPLQFLAYSIFLLYHIPIRGRIVQMVVRVENTNVSKEARTERLKAIRLLLGLTQKQFADGLGMTREGYQKLENGQNNISLEVLERLKSVYGISADYLLYGEFQDEEKMWYMIKNCSEITKLEIMVRLIEYFTDSRKKLFGQGEFELREFLNELLITEGTTEPQGG